MRADLVPGAAFPDLVLPDHTDVPRRLSELQSGETMVLVLIRGSFCPKDRQHLQELARFHPQMTVGYTRLVTITTDDWHTTNNLRQQLGAHWPFLYDTERTVQQELEIREYTDPANDPMIPHTIVLGPDLEIFRIYQAYYYWGRPSMAELHADLRELTMRMRADWDPTDPELRRAWEAGDTDDFYPYGQKSMERMMREMAGAVDQYAGRARA